jgi:hypothetical protein
MQMKKILLVMMLCIAPLALAAVSSKGTATVTYTGKVSAKVKQEALQKAKVNALDRYFSEVNPAKARNYELVREKLVGTIDDYVLGATTLSEQNDEKGRLYSVTVRVDINSPKLENALQNSSAVANATESEKSLLTFVFVARQQKSVQSFDDRVHSRTDTEDTDANDIDAKRKTSESERVSRRTSSSTTTGGSTLRQSDAIEWKVTRAGEINSVMTGTFSNAGYEVVEAEYVDKLNIDAIREDYSFGDDLSQATLLEVSRTVKAADIPLIAIGTLDVGMRDIDPVSNLTVSSVGPTQFAGLGPDESVARVNALKKAAESAAQQLMNELNAKGVK